jgi:hypothetical protein
MSLHLMAMCTMRDPILPSPSSVSALFPGQQESRDEHAERDDRGKALGAESGSDLRLFQARRGARMDQRARDYEDRQDPVRHRGSALLTLAQAQGAAPYVLARRLA